jgi:hypothetical protein
MGTELSKSPRETCLHAEQHGGTSYWKDNTCQPFTKEVCESESVGGSWSWNASGEYCAGNDRWVETGKYIDRRRVGRDERDEVWRSVRGKELEALLEGICEGRWEECGMIVEVRMG